jgi:hypothetical protein
VQDGEQKRIALELDKAFGKLHVTSSPEEGADVYVDGQKKGTTPYVFDPCPSGQYLIKVQKQYYNTVTEQITVTDNAEVRRTIILAPNVGTLIVSAPSSRIFINGENVGSDSYNAKFPPGKYVVKAERPKHYPVTKDVIITVGETSELQFTLSAMQGSISIFVNPIEAKNAEIFIDGESMGLAPKVFTIPIGDYSVEVRVMGFLSKKNDVAVKENDNTMVHFTLLSYAGSIQQEIDKWKKRGKYSMGTAALSAVLYGYFTYASMQAYDNYNSAETTDDAVQFKDEVQLNDLSANIFVGAAGTAGLYWGWCKIKQVLAEYKMDRR